MSTRSSTAPHRTFARVYNLYTSPPLLLLSDLAKVCIYMYAQVCTAESDLFG